MLSQIERPATEDFTFACGLLRQHIVEGVPLQRLADAYGLNLPRLRAKLIDHLAACHAALGIEPPAMMPEAAPELPPAVAPVRVRERVPRAA
ncbi:hypothetical protein [Methylobacterium sp. AMS5]|uniref:hypothetical protein n=1 Tax=Methylobacterium sp. AMS5 TaxID=925818 RepID=UPI00118735AA|nr:hypothetical protein [Methylobacterium sp. AMS5]